MKRRRRIRRHRLTKSGLAHPRRRSPQHVGEPAGHERDAGDDGDEEQRHDDEALAADLRREQRAVLAVIAERGQQLVVDDQSGRRGLGPGALGVGAQVLELGLQRGLALAGGRVCGCDLGAQLVLALLGRGERRVQRVVLGGEAGDLVLCGSVALQARLQFLFARTALGQGVLDLAEAIGEICFAGGRGVGGALELGEARGGGRAGVVGLGEAVCISSSAWSAVS